MYFRETCSYLRHSRGSGGIIYTEGGWSSRPAHTHVWEAETESAQNNLFSRKKINPVSSNWIWCKFFFFFCYFIYLHTSSQHFMKHVCSLLHDPHVFRSGVGTPAVLYGVNEAVSKFVQRTQQILFDEAHHAVICRVKTEQELLAVSQLWLWFVNDLFYTQSKCVWLRKMKIIDSFKSLSEFRSKIRRWIFITTFLLLYKIAMWYFCQTKLYR